MLFEQIIREAMTAPKSPAVPVRPYTRKRPLQDKRDACHDALRREVRV